MSDSHKNDEERERQLDERAHAARSLEAKIAGMDNWPIEQRIEKLLRMLEADETRGFYLAMKPGAISSIWLRSIPTPGGISLAMHEAMGRCTTSGTYCTTTGKDNFTLAIWEALARLARTPGSLPDRIHIGVLPDSVCL